MIWAKNAQAGRLGTFRRNHILTTVKCPSMNINYVLTGGIVDNKFVIQADYEVNNDFNIYADDLTETDAGPYIKQFVMIEDNIGDETSSTLAGLIKMLK